MGHNDRKVIVLGLDGATFDVLLPRVQQGQMPNLARMLRNGVWGGLQSTTPPFSAQAWVSLATGMNQARHGVVDFWEPSPDHGRRNFVSARQISAETLWQMVSRQGLRVGVVNVPVTYPPQRVNGYLVSGLLTPQGKDDYVHPLALKGEIESLVPDYSPDPFDPLGSGRRQILEVQGWMEKHERISSYLMDRHPTDLVFNVVQALDHLQHLFWEDIVRGADESRFASLIDRCYRQVDDIIGHRSKMVRDQTNLFLVSDHGFGPVHKWFHVNRFLHERGFLTLGEVQGGGMGSAVARLGLTPQALRSLVRRLDVLGLRRWLGRMARVTLGRQLDRTLAPPIDWSRTQAVSGSPATEGVFINLKGREPQGVVEPGDSYEALRERLIAELLALRDPETGEPVVQAVYRREQLYEGPFLDLLPDLVFDLGDGPYLASDAPLAAQVLEPLARDYLQGRHRSVGIFVAAGPDIREGEKSEGARIIDVAPTVLYALGLPIPENIDGRPLVEIFRQDYQAAHPVRYTSPEPVGGAAPESVYDQEDTAEMERRLRGLGYLS
jgi:predicted AlkP superfamily phosphohydrolase/phosphomutase